LINEELIEDPREAWIAEIEEELKSAEPIRQMIKYRRFISYSKGWRNGKKRMRKHWKEIHLIKNILGGRFHQWHNYSFDTYAKEILGQHAEPEDLMERIIKLWGY